MRKTKNSRDGILPNRVSVFGLTFRKSVASGSRYFSTDDFLTLNMVYKIDLHTHSIISPDGAIAESEYANLLNKGILDCIAITDHNEIKFAKRLHEQFGDKIIVGEEITTRDGEMIGLFLTRTIPAGLTARETAKAIHEQNGLVYIPHPFETLRKGIQKAVLEQFIEDIDIVEVFNGRGWGRGRNGDAEFFCKAYNLIGAASSDAHGYYGAGKTFSILEKIPTRGTLKELLEKGSLQKKYAPFVAYFYPAVNKIKNKLHV